YAEFLMERSRDEMMVGLTPNPRIVREISGWSNLSHPHTWVYCKRGGVSPMIEFGKKSYLGSNGFDQGDRIAIYLNVEARQVSWFKNGTFIITNLPDYPLPKASEY